MTQNVCCFTGHRHIENEKSDLVKKAAETEVKKLISKNVDTFICGGAVGFDMMCAKIILNVKEKTGGIKLHMVIPCYGQEKYFSLENKKLYEYILNHADDVLYVSEKYTPWCMHERNRYMVDNSDYLIAYCVKESGGSFYTREYAKKKKINIIDILVK